MKSYSEEIKNIENTFQEKLVTIENDKRESISKIVRNFLKEVLLKEKINLDDVIEIAKITNKVFNYSTKEEVKKVDEKLKLFRLKLGSVLMEMIKNESDEFIINENLEKFLQSPMGTVKVTQENYENFGILTFHEHENKYNIAGVCGCKIFNESNQNCQKLIDEFIVLLEE